MMKHFSVLAMFLLILSACAEKGGAEPGTGDFDNAAALKFKGTVPSVTSDNGAVNVQLSWTQGESVGIVPLAAKAVSTKSAGSPAYRYVVSETLPTSSFIWTDFAFMPDEQIPVHKFQAFSPYSPEAYGQDGISFVIPDEQAGTDPMAFLPVYAETEISEPIDGATVLMKFESEAVVLRVPRLEGAGKGVLYAAEGAPAICGEALFNVENRSMAAVSGSSSIEMTFAEDSDSFYAVILPGDHTDKEFKVVYTTASGDVEKTFDGADYEKGKSYALTSNDVASVSAYEVDLSSVDFSGSFIYEAQNSEGLTVAIITKEYLPASNQQAVVVYGTKMGSSSMVMDSSNPVGLVAKVLKSAPAGEYTAYTDVAATDPVHGGIYSFNADVLNYTQAGTSVALDKVYVSYDPVEKNTSVYAAMENVSPVSVNVVPRTVTFSDRGEDKAYKLVKIGRQIWFAENMETTKYNDGTSIAIVSKARDLWSCTEAAYVNTASTVNRIVYNVAVIQQEKFLPVGSGWKIPTEGDLKNLIANVPQANMLTAFSNDAGTVLGHNVTGMSVTVRGRVTNNGWEKDLDPCFWCSAPSETEGKQKCLLVRMNEAQATQIPQVNSGQNVKFGFWVRLMRGLY